MTSFDYEGGACRLSGEQLDKVKSWDAMLQPRNTREVVHCIAAEFGIECQTRSELIALLHRLDMVHRKPMAISRKPAPEKQTTFATESDALPNQMPDDESAVFADAAHPTHTLRPVCRWGPKNIQVAVEQSSGRDRLNIHGAINLETGRTVMKDVLTVDAVHTIA